jgi:Zn-dependent M28 family amino/carboxypeptidase
LALEKAIDWAVATLAGDRLENARREKVMVPHWVRGKESARLVAPVERELVMLGLGGSVGTGGKPLRGEVLVLGNVDEVEARAADVAGKIVLFNQVMPPYDHEERNSFYGETVPARTHGATRAAKHGAKAVLIRSVTAHSLRSPHTGATRYEEGVRKIPAAALTVEDAELVSRFAARGKVELELRMAAKTLPDAESGNVVAELPGRERREEVVVIGGHIDSWDVGDGSTDDLSGCIIAMEAARMLRELGLVPRRTIRVVLFTNEENGLRGAEAYHAAHGKERHVAAIESDSGAGAPLGFTVAGSEEQVAALSVLAPLFVHTGAATIVAGGSGADIGVLVKDGALGLGLRPDGSHYFDLHHSPADTAEKIVPEHLQMNAAAMAIMAYVLAERE